MNEVIPRDDETEAERLQEMYGLGEISVLTDEQVKMYGLRDLGVVLDDLP